MNDVVELKQIPPLGHLYARALMRGWQRTGTGPWLRPAGGPPTVTVRAVRLDLNHLDTYRTLIAEPRRDQVPAGYLHALTFPLAMTVMTDPRFPLAAAGLVHIHNQIEVLADIPVDAPLDLRVRASAPRAHHRGTAADLITTVSIGADVLWSAVSTYLSRNRRTTAAKYPEAPARTATHHWQIEADEGRRYAQVSGDRNPIHLSKLAARAFGFPQPIMHGMDSAARLLAVAAPWRPPTFRWTVDFAAPILLPSAVEVAVELEGESVLMHAWRPADNRPLLTARLDPLQDRV